MKLIFILMFLFSVSAFASLPLVTCQLSSAKLSPEGGSESTHTNKNVTVQTTDSKSTTGGFVMTAKLTQVCATSHGPCYDSYDLDVSISKGEATSYISEHLKSSQATRAVLSALDLKSERGMVSCVLN